LYLARRENIGYVVSQIFNVKVGSLSPAATEVCIQWVMEQTLSVEDKQRLFLCSTLGYIALIKQVYCLPLPDDETRKCVFDKLLQNLEKCFKKKFCVPGNCLHLLERSAFTLVQGCSKPGWLTFAAYFRPFFGMKYVLDVEIESCEYSKDDYLKLLSLLVFGVPNIRREIPEGQSLFQPYLKRILQFAPDEDILFQMFQNKDFYRFFYSPSEREHFFIEFYRSSLNSRTENLDEKLEHLNRLPVHVRGKMSGLIYAYVQHFINTAAEPSADVMDAVIHLISENLSDDKVLYLLRHLSQSPSTTHHHLFLQLLSDRRFTKKWEKVLSSEKVKICTSWLGIKAHSSKENGARIKETFETVDILTSCQHISSNKNLIQDLCGNALNWLLHEDPIRIIEEFKEIENYSPHVQNCFQELVQVTLHRHPYLVTNKEVLGNLCGNTR
jgi:hypothetical protein